MLMAGFSVAGAASVPPSTSPGVSGASTSSRQGQLPLPTTTTSSTSRYAAAALIPPVIAPENNNGVRRPESPAAFPAPSPQPSSSLVLPELMMLRQQQQ